MSINRFTNYPQKREDDILYEFKAKVIGCLGDFELYLTDTEAFWFLDIEDEKLEGEGSFDMFTYKIDNSLNKSRIVEELKHRKIQVLITKGEYPNYSFYGVYQLDRPYVNVSGVGMAVEAYNPLTFKMILDYFDVG